MSGFKSVSLSDIQRAFITAHRASENPQHRPIHAELDKALRKPQRAATSGRRETEKRSKIEKENTIE